MRLYMYFSQLQTAALSTGVATMSSLAQLRDAEKQRQHRCDDSKLAKSGSDRSEQLLMMLTN